MEIEFGVTKLPKYDVPEGYDSWTYLNHLCRQGFESRYPEDDGTLRRRLDYELDVIRTMGYVDYFLIVWDFINYARSQGIMVGPGRGSAAGSIVSYTLGITNIDPVRDVYKRQDRSWTIYPVSERPEGKPLCASLKILRQCGTLLWRSWLRFPR